MPVKNLYICDHCEKTQEDEPKDMHFISIRVQESSPRYSSSIGGKEKHKQLWCRKCLVEAGIVDWKTPDATPPPTPPTLEDMIHEIVADAMANQE